MEVPKTSVWEIQNQVPMTEKLEIKKENSVSITRKIRFALKSSEDSVCDDVSSDEHPAVTTGECNDDPGGSLANHIICEEVEASHDASQPAGQLACEEEFEKELNQEVTPDVGKKVTKESLKDLPDMQNPKVSHFQI
jgi:hypothetical protein